jgi:hypothetical protein
VQPATILHRGTDLTHLSGVRGISGPEGILAVDSAVSYSGTHRARSGGREPSEKASLNMADAEEETRALTSPPPVPVTTLEKLSRLPVRLWDGLSDLLDPVVEGAGLIITEALVACYGYSQEDGAGEGEEVRRTPTHTSCSRLPLALCETHAEMCRSLEASPSDPIGPAVVA